MNTAASPFRVRVTHGPACSFVYVCSLRLARFVQRTQRTLGRTAALERTAVTGPGVVSWVPVP